jgi:peptidoglycan/xylan/chitin deacetylase (PgdA/CDA1 family)
MQKFDSFLYSSGFSRLARPFTPFLGHILMIHRVVEPDGKPRLPENQLYEITPAILKNTIRFFRDRNYVFKSLDAMVDDIQAGEKSEKFVCVTFDDGYTDTCTTAYNILKEEGIPFCVYITTDFPDRKAAFWWNMLEESLLAGDEMRFSLDGKEHRIPCAAFQEKRDAFQSICRLVLNSENGISAAWKAVFEPLRLDRTAWVDRLAMSWDLINRLGRDPLVTIGAHTCTHPSLAGLTEEEALHEICDSRAIIREKTGLKVEHFAYPYGSTLDVTQREARLAASLGFKTAVTTNRGNVYRYHRKRLMLLPRINVSPIRTMEELTLAADGCIPQIFLRF